MKLGYIYTVTAGGYDDDRVRINTGDWSSVVDDERQLWQKFSVNGESIAMTIVRDGVVFAITRIIGGGRPDDNITTWVFVPSTLHITGSQIKQVIEAIKEINKVGTKRISRESFMGNETLALDYPEKKYRITFNPSMGNELAGRYPTTDYSMEEILGLPYQESYTKYKYVFLVSQKSDLKSGLTDLSTEDIIESICVLPLSEARILDIFGSSTVTVKFQDGRAFNSHIIAKKGQIIDLIAEKKDCIPLRLKGQAIADEKEIEISKDSQQWRRVISPNLFKVEDSKTGIAIISGVNIYILDPQYNNQNKSLPENRLKKVSVRITAKGYEKFEGEIDLSGGSVTIPLSRIIEKETYSYENEFGDNIKVTISGPGAKSHSPLKGYRVNDHKLIYTPEELPDDRGYHTHDLYNSHHKHRRGFAWSEFCYGMLTVVFLALICWGGVYLYDTFFDENIPTRSVNDSADSSNPTTSGGDSTDSVKTTRAKAMAYLDNETGVWQRDSLIKYPELEGLFEELNSYQFDKVLKRESGLKESKNFKKICDAIRANSGKQFDRHFRDDGICAITVSKYIDKLNQAVEQAQTNTSAGVASEAAKKAKLQQKKPKTDSKNAKKTSSSPKPKRGNTVKS